MALQNVGLPNGGITTHYTFLYDSTLAGAGGIEPARTIQVMASCEADFNLMQSWFPGVAITFAMPMEVDVNNDTSNMATWGLPIALNSATNDAGYLRMLLVAEVTEMFMQGQAKGWFPGSEGSIGEGLSRFFAQQFLLSSGLGLREYPGWAWTSNAWLTSANQPDWVNNVDSFDYSEDIKIGCSILFIYYLFVQLQFTINEIVAAAAPNLAGVYANLTQDAGNPFPFFQRLLQTYPGSAGLSATDNLDNPFPIGLTSIWVEKSTFGYDEVQDVINKSGGVFSAAFWVVIEGFSKKSIEALGISIELDGSLTTTPGITVFPSMSAQVDYEDSSKPSAPQRIRIPYDIKFTAVADPAFPVAGGSPAGRDLFIELQQNGKVVSASDASATFELVAGADPYFTNVDPTQGNVFYLSQDLRVFTATPGLQNPPLAGGPLFGVSGPYGYIQALLNFLNQNYSSGAQDPFTTILPAQIDTSAGDSSVSPFTGSNPPQQNYNFAIARVRLRGSAGASASAQHVKVFFRLWATQTVDTDYQPSTTYTSSVDAAGRPISPLVGVGTGTIPFFASGNLIGNTDYIDGGANNRTLQIGAGGAAWFYFGCFLDLYDQSNQVNGKPIQKWLAGTHHCLVAQIACNSAPILAGGAVTPSPQNSDKLAQRNLQITTSDNPGEADTHRVPQTFDVRPTQPFMHDIPGLGELPDELMIDWGDVPVGSTASIYWPRIKAVDVLNLADTMYCFHALSLVDPNTVQCVVAAGVTYVPIPVGVGDNYAGLLTIDLPTTVRTGQLFKVTVRRIVTRRMPEQTQSKRGSLARFGSVPKKASDVPAINIKRPKTWRFVAGAFQIRIPVETSITMLPAEQDTLAILKWRRDGMLKSDRWRPVLDRYIQYIAARVAGLGGDSDRVRACVDGAPRQALSALEGVTKFVGVIVKIDFDCHGAFVGFVVKDCRAEHVFKTRDCGLGDLILRAFQNRFRIVVTVSSSPNRIVEVTIVE